jgi:outer membrane protein
MKRSASIVTKFALGLAIAGTVIACKQSTTDSKPAAAATGTTAKAEIVYINEDSVSAKYKYAVDMRARLEEKSKSVQSDVASRQQAVQREYQQAQQAAATMTQDQQKAAGERIQKDGQAFQQYQQNAGAQLQQEQSEEIKKLYDKIVEFTKKYAKDNGYKMVLTFQNGNVNMLYGDPSLDVTNDFLKKLNDTYDKK